MERGLHHPPLPQVERAVGKHQAIAQVRAELVEHRTFAKTRTIGDQDLVHKPRTGHEKRGQRTEVHSYHIAVIAQ
ncbi:hypothetical protein GCM10027184_38060 [Saccharothrix stipae]